MSPAESAPLLSLTDVRKSFGGARALERASLDLYAGSVTALLGEMAPANPRS